MMSQILGMIQLFDAEISGTELVSQNGKEYIFLDFENANCWASLVYEKITKDIITSTIEDKNRKFYYQLKSDGQVFDNDREATILDNWCDYTNAVAKIWNKAADCNK